LPRKVQEAGRAGTSEGTPMTGADLKALRKEAGLTQKALAARAGTSHNAVLYRERAAMLDTTGWAVRRFLAVLGKDSFPDYYAYARTWGVRVRTH
jgi:hypothetical protein